MKVNCYMIVNSNGKVRVTKTSPSLFQNEIAIKLDMNLSDKFFQRFIPHAKLDVPDDFVLTPEMEVELVMPKDEEYAEAVFKRKGET